MDILSAYETKIGKVIEVYIGELYGGEEQLESIGAFSGLLNRIAKEVFSNPKFNGGQNGEKRTNLDLSNVGMLYDILDIFIALCGKYNHVTMVNPLTFSNFIRIPKEVFTSWADGEATPDLERFAKNLSALAETNLYSNVAERNSIGSIFLLKAKHQYRDNDNIQQIEIKTVAPQISKADLTALLSDDME